MKSVREMTRPRSSAATRRSLGQRCRGGWNLGFEVGDLVLRVLGSGFRAKVVLFRELLLLHGSGFRGQNSWFKVQFRFRGQNNPVGFRV